MRKLITLLSFTALVACSDVTTTINSDVSPAKLQAGTAQFFNTSTSNVRIGGLKQGLTGTAYKAQVGRAAYDCHYIRGAISCDASRRVTQSRDEVWR